MSRVAPIRKRRKKPDTALIGAEAAFWLVLVAAVGLGGMRALTGLPMLANLLVPSDMMAAEANSPQVSGISFPVEVRADSGLYAPRVLAAGEGFPAWLQSRIEAARNGTTVPVTPAPNTVPSIAIVIDDLGADGIDTRRAIALPKEVTLSFLPYPETSTAYAREGLSAGHQIMVHVPMEPDGKTDPGPNALLTSLDSATNISRLDWALARIPGYAGINNHEGSRFTSDREALIPVMEHVADKHVFFMDSRTAPGTEVVSLARAFGVASAGRDVFLDDVQTASSINSELAHAETVARTQGVAIVIGHPHPVTMDALTHWTATAQARGFRLITASEAIRLKTERDVRSLSAAR